MVDVCQVIHVIFRPDTAISFVWERSVAVWSLQNCVKVKNTLLFSCFHTVFTPILRHFQFPLSSLDFTYLTITQVLLAAWRLACASSMSHEVIVVSFQSESNAISLDSSTRLEENTEPHTDTNADVLSYTDCSKRLTS